METSNNVLIDKWELKHFSNMVCIRQHFNNGECMFIADYVNEDAANFMVTSFNNCKAINPNSPQKVAEVLPDIVKSLKELIYIIECNRATNGVSLDIMYQTEYWNAKNALKQATE